ncbi:MAG: EAL domain-containing protein [Pseudomonadota bacterium]
MNKLLRRQLELLADGQNSETPSMDALLEMVSAQYDAFESMAGNERKRVSREEYLRRKLRYQSSHDALTGLVNRNEFELRIRESLEPDGNRAGDHSSVLYLDIDQFKVINDTCGHVAGDRLLKELAGIMRDKVRGTDVLSRLGGDEFGVLLRGCDATSAERIAEELRRGISDFGFRWEGRVFRHSASIGVVHVNPNTDSAASILSAADVACFTAKEGGRNRVHVYHAGGVHAQHQQMLWVNRLARACEEDRLRLYYQPIVPLNGDSRQPAHYELLLRMVDRFGSIVPPGDFIPAAERYNLMPRIDRWVVRHALQNLAHRRSSPRPFYTLSINLSGTSLSTSSFLDFVRDEMQQHDLSEHAICFEITETAAIGNISSVAHFMFELKKMGCLFSLDDFGSGLSSLAYLKQLPVDLLKIDGQFVHNICESPVDTALVGAMTQIGTAMGIKTVGERVESHDTARRLAAMGVDYGQGFHFAEPVAASSRACFDPEATGTTTATLRLPGASGLFTTAG